MKLSIWCADENSPESVCVVMIRNALCPGEPRPFVMKLWSEPLEGE